MLKFKLHLKLCLSSRLSMLASTAWRKARDSDHVIVIYETWFDCVIERWSSTAVGTWLADAVTGPVSTLTSPPSE